MSSNMEYCLYHEDKDELSSIQKELQKSGWLPRQCVHRLAMAVCSCRKNKDPVVGLDEMLTYKETLQKQLDEDRSNFPKHLISFLDRWLNKATEIDYSSCQFIAVLAKAKHGDFTMLSRAALSTNSKISKRDMQREINRKKKLTPYQIESIKRKKRQKMDSCIINLPIFPTNFRKMKIDFVSTNKSYIKPQYKINNKNFDEKKVETCVKVWGDPASIKTICQLLLEEAKAVQKRVDDEWRARMELLQARRERKAAAMRRYLDSLDDSEDDFDMYDHDILIDDFSLKVHKTAKSKSKAVLVKAQPSALNGGHCLQCLKAFTDLQDKTKCTFHKGFSVSRKSSNTRTWSCYRLQ